MSRKTPSFELRRAPRNARVGVVAARFNDEIVEKLLQGCLTRLNALGISENRMTVERVPGAFELPLVAKAMCRTGKFDAVICLGAVIRGQTPHFDFVAGECARGIAQVSRDEITPVIFGVLTTNTEQQARDRIGGKHGHAGVRAAEAAVEMIAVMQRLTPRRK
jgi:6,7-dimethyl-8-ribityllumazine synthase